MIEFIDQIEIYLKDLDREKFVANRLVIDAVARNLELLGEASTHIPEVVKSKFSGIPWGKMRGLRIILAHNYMGADASVMWDTTKDDLKPLRARLVEIKKSHGEL